MEYDKRWLPTRAVGYLRTSADRAEPGYTLGIQRREVESWAADHNVYIAGVFVDEGEAGSATLERRAGLTEALATVAELENGALVVYRLSCLDPDPLMQTLVESEVRRVGRRVFSSLDHPRQVTFDLDFRVSDARYQRAQASLRRRVGRLRKHHTGGYAYGAHHPPATAP
jgi:hypothetical protein